MPYRRLLLATLILLGTGCGDPPVDGDAGLDAASSDVDASTADAGADPDASQDDAGSLDAGPSDSGPPDSGPPEPCTTPGTTERVACGMCGEVTRFCAASGVWSYGVCEDEGTCAPGTTDTAACGDCGTQARRCTTACEWEPMGACTGEGVCTPGETTRSGDGCPSGQQRDVLCSAACAFEPTSACTMDGCDTPGTLETVSCGMCGRQDRFCTTARVWDYGACTGEGVCMPGTSGTQACGMCGTQPTVCTDSCTWAAFGACTGEGACVPGTTRRTTVGCTGTATRLVQCSDACGYTIEVEPCRTSLPVDVLFLVDATPSNLDEFRSQSAAFGTGCVDRLLALTDVQVGIAWYGDMTPTAEPFAAGVELGAATTTAIAANIGARAYMGGGEDSTMEALSILTGATPAPGSIPFVCSAGRVAGGCWRPGARRAIVLHTDEVAKGGPLAAGAGLYSPWPTGPTWTTLLPQLMTQGVSVFTILDDGFTSTGDPVGQYTRMATDLGQPAADVQVEGATEPGVGLACDRIVARVREIAGL